MNAADTFDAKFNSADDKLKAARRAVIDLVDATIVLLSELDLMPLDGSTLEKRDNILGRKRDAIAIRNMLSAANDTLWHSS